jgi:hypothetical protein
MSLIITNITKLDTTKLNFISFMTFFGASSEITFQFLNDAGTGNITGLFAKILDNNFDTVDSITLTAADINYDITNNMYICNTITTVLPVAFYKLYLTDGTNEYESEPFKIVDLTLMDDD